MSKKPAPKTLFTRLKQEVDKSNNFIDYFLVLGIQPTICLNKQLYDLNVKVQNATVLQPEILSKYPPFDKALVSIDDGILTYCSSKKFELVEALVQPPEEIFSFILDNNFFSIEYPQKYVTCLRLYEPVASYKLLKKLLEEKKINEEHQSARSMRRNCSLSENKKNNEALTGNMRKTTMENLPMKSRDNFLFIPKVICLVSIYPFIKQHVEILQLIYRYSCSSSIEIPIEKLLLNLIIEVPVPPRGLCSIKYDFHKQRTFDLTRSEMNKLPSIEFELEQICLCFNLDQIKNIFRHLLFETKIIFFSDNINTLFHVILGFLSFLYPLKYPFQVASYVPEQNYSIIESISPYILGINKVYTKSFFMDNNLEISEMTILIVDINNKNVVQSNEKEDFPKLPKNISYKLEKDIIELAGRWKSRLESNKPLANEEFNKLLGHYFFNCIISIMKNYAHYINNDYFTSHENILNTNINTLFKVNEYVQSFPSSEQPFYAKFVNDSQMFSDFIYKKMIPKDNKEKLEILFLDESIIEQKWTIFDKKDNVFFITSEEYKIKSEYKPPVAKRLNKEEIKAFQSEELREKMLNYAQVVTIAEASGKVTFDYLLFPQLNNETFLSESCLSEYFIWPSCNDELESINTDIVSKSYLSQIVVQNFEMENYLYLTWLQLWAFSFHYIDENEHNYRFEQMLGILDKVTHHEIEIFNLLFDSLKNKNSLVLRLYKKLILFKINPSCYIYSIISKVIDKTDLNQIKNKQGLFNQVTPKAMKPKMRERSIRNSFEEEVLMDRVKFYPYYNCDECQYALDLEQLSSNFSEMKREVMWAYCPPCQKCILPKLEVRLGVELNIDMTHAGQTSTLEQVVLHSPYHLKINVKDGIYREYGLALDINQFKMKFTPLFWNAIWYFRLLNLDYAFFIPYSEALVNPIEKRVTTTFALIKSPKPRSAIKKSSIKRGRFDNLALSRPNSFQLIQKTMKVLGHTMSSLELTVSTLSNTNVLDNSTISDMSSSKLSDSYYEDGNSSCFPLRCLTQDRIIEENENEEELDLKKLTSTPNASSKPFMLLETNQEGKQCEPGKEKENSSSRVKALNSIIIN